jgi:putative oxidoreductase
MRDAALLGLRLTLGGYLAAHGAQKLFGTFDGPGLEKAAVGFEHMGLKPGKAFATLAAGSEFAGGILTAVGAAHPVGPVAVAGAMTVASVTHADKGPLLQKGGFELPASYLAAALALAAHDPDHYSFDRLTGLRLPKGLVRATVAGAAALTIYSTARVVQTKRAARAEAPSSPEATRAAAA